MQAVLANAGVVRAAAMPLQNSTPTTKAPADSSFASVMNGMQQQNTSTKPAQIDSVAANVQKTVVPENTNKQSASDLPLSTVDEAGDNAQPISAQTAVPETEDKNSKAEDAGVAAKLPKLMHAFPAELATSVKKSASEKQTTSVVATVASPADGQTSATAQAEVVPVSAEVLSVLAKAPAVADNSTQSKNTNHKAVAASGALPAAEIGQTAAKAALTVAADKSVTDDSLQKPAAAVTVTAGDASVLQDAMQVAAISSHDAVGLSANTQEYGNDVAPTSILPQKTAVDAAPQHNTWLHMDAAPVSDIKAPQMLMAGAKQIEVGIADSTHGWLQVRAELSGTNSVTASLTSASTVAQQSLKTELPQISAWLSEQHLAVERLTVHASGESTQMNMQKSFDDGRGGQYQPSGNTSGGNAGSSRQTSVAVPDETQMNDFLPESGYSAMPAWMLSGAAPLGQASWLSVRV